MASRMSLKYWLILTEHKSTNKPDKYFTKLRFLLLIGGVFVVDTALGRLVAAADGEFSDFRIGADFGVAKSGLADFGVAESGTTDVEDLFEASTSMM